MSTADTLPYLTTRYYVGIRTHLIILTFLMNNFHCSIIMICLSASQTLLTDNVSNAAARPQIKSKRT